MALLKSHVELREVYAALLRDASCAFPALAKSLERDFQTLCRSIEARDLHLMMVDLPELGKHLDRCLSCGKYTLSRLPLGKRASARVQLPRFMVGLYLLVFDGDGCLRGDCNVEAVFFLRQVYYLAKKASFSCCDTAVVDEVRDFLRVDQSLPEPERLWSDTFLREDTIRQTYLGFKESTKVLSRIDELTSQEVNWSLFLTNLDLVSGLVTSALGPYKAEDWSFRHGPGAIAETTKVVNKYKFTNWPNRLDNAYPYADFGFANYQCWASAATQEVTTRERSSRLLAVPKTLTKPRLIAAEPSEHQWCQQNIWHYFRERTAATWVGDFIKFTDQSRNQALCLEGSRSGKLCTVDLSAASDRVTPHVVGQLFRGNPKLLVALQSTRTRSIVWDPKDPGQRAKSVEGDPILGTHHLRKFSTMGSAVTFPVESIAFLVIAIASVLTARKLRATSGGVRQLASEVSVFGDDIIIPRDAWDVLHAGLNLLWFKVNTAKSFSEGNFRESCGVDAFRGELVTPVYWHQPVERTVGAIVSSVEVHNNFHKKFLLHSASVLARRLRRYGIPSVSANTTVFGLRTYCAADITYRNVRYCKRLHKPQVKLIQPYAVSVRTATDDDSALLQYFTEDPPPFTKWSSGVAERPRPRLRAKWVDAQDLGLT